METTPDRLPPACDIRAVTCLLLGEIGDALVCTPTLHALRKRYPDARFTLIVRKVAAPLFAGNADIDALLVFDVPTLWRKLRFLLDLAFHRCDLWVDLQAPTYNTFGTDSRIYRRNALLMMTARSRYRLGFAVPALRPNLTHAVAPPTEAILQNENIVDTTLRLVGNLDRADRRKRLSLANPDLAWARQWKDSRFSAEDVVLGLFFGAKQPAKFWPLDNVCAFIDLWLNASPRHRILLLGGEHEKASAAAILDAVAPTQVACIADAVAAASLMQTAALMAGCALVVATDSGPMHIADALDLPLVALLSHQNFQAIWRPLSANAVVLARQVECGPCLRDTCDKGNRCMAGLSAADAFAAVAAKLAPHPVRRAD